MDFEKLLAWSQKEETLRLNRDNRLLMKEEYRLEKEEEQRLEEGTYQFPAISEPDLAVGESPVFSGLVRRQDWFSAKIHVRATPCYFHRHEFVEILYMYRGTCRQYVENLKTLILLEEGDLFLLNQNVIHALFQKEPDAVLINIIVPGAWITPAFLNRMNRDSPLFSFFVRAGEGGEDTEEYFHYHRTEPGCREIVEKLMEEFYRSQPFSREAAEFYLQLLFISLNRSTSLPEMVSRQRAGNYQLRERFFRYLYENSASATLEGMAEDLRYNTSYLSRLIRKNCGAGFRELLREIRMEKAILLLGTSGLSVEEIALLCGYQTPVPLYKEMRRRFGLSPSEYREAYANRFDTQGKIKKDISQSGEIEKNDPMP